MAQILIVEDDRDLADTLADWLTYEGHQVSLAYDGLEASSAIEEGVFDLILLDWVMPGRSGIEVCRAYRMAGGTAPVIMLTGKVSMDNKEVGFDAGADDYLIKPFNLKELSWRMRAWLRRSFNAFPLALTTVERQSFPARKCPACSTMFETTLSMCPDDRAELIDETVEFLVGDPLSKNYAILSVIGSGPMSTVLKVWHKQTQKCLAMKLLESSHVKDQTYVKRFQHEGATLKKLAHPNIIGIHDFGVSSCGQPYIVMDFIEGKSLARLLNRGQAITIRRALHIAKQVCDGVDFAHNHGIIHRDLKPGNVLIEKSANKEHVKIVDFGISRTMEDQNDEHLRLTGSGEILGTALYMSPEQCLGRQLDARSDIYSMGCLLYEILSGTPPLVGRNVLETLHLHINESAPALRLRRSDAPESLEKTLSRALAKEPGRRFRSMADLADALEACAKLL